MPQVIEYYFAPQSPWVYLGHDAFVALARRHGAQIDLRPIDLGGRVFPVSGGLPLAQRPTQRQLYRLTELKRWSAFRGMPLNLHPKFFPVAGDPAARAVLAAQSVCGNESALDLLGAICSAVWVQERNTADEAELGRIAEGLGLPAAKIIALSHEPEIQARYDAFTEKAIALNVFGAPTYVFNGELFWGQDRLDFLDRALSAR